MSVTNEHTESYVWHTQPAAASLIGELTERSRSLLPEVRQLESELLEKTGTRLVDWIDHFSVPAGGSSIVDDLNSSGFKMIEVNGEQVYRHQQGIFPAIKVSKNTQFQIIIKVEDVTRFIIAHRLDSIDVEGRPLSTLRQAKVWENELAECWIIERHGVAGWKITDCEDAYALRVLAHLESFLLRPRTESGFADAKRLIEKAVGDVGVDRSCDLFFATEREYWQSRNQAARTQKQRQDVLGMGWANHDHHTYRSSRECFADLISVLKMLGFHCRERFFAGEQAGWGAQVLEQPNCGIVIFADVDLLPGEVEGDFATNGLPPNDKLGTVGLWCKLHGEAFLKAGMHHLECQFDFDAARKQLQSCGIESMTPFTDMPHLKQAFTKPEIWVVDEDRIDSALAAGWIDEQQAENFRSQGAVGSHLEILERNQGYKGFNQTGISHIIRETDPRNRGK